MTGLDSILISVGRAAWAWWIATEDEKLYRYGVLMERLVALERSFPDDTEIRHLEGLA